MKKYSFLILFTLVFSIFILGCGKVEDPEDAMEPPIEQAVDHASPIELPATESILSIEIAGGYKDTIVTDKELIATFVQKVLQAKPTSKQASQDVPTLLQYTRVDIVVEGDISSIFIYQEDSKWYIEQPNHGVYETDENTLKLLEEN